MGDAVFAIGYAVFAVLFCTQNLMSLNRDWQAAIHKTIANPFETIPYFGTGSRQRFKKDIDSPTELYEWLTKVFATSLFHEQEVWDQESLWNDTVVTNDSFTPATIGSFNRVLMVRLSAKMWSLEAATAGAFDEYSPTSLAGRDHSKLDATSSYTVAEDKRPLCPDAQAARPANASVPPCIWYAGEGKGSYADAGGFVVFLNPADGQQAFEDKLRQLEEVGMFDLKLATFVIDMMVFNTNLEIFLQKAWIFEFDFAGNCHQGQECRGFNLNLNSTTESRYVTLNVLKFILAGMVIVFLCIELRAICDVGFAQHFRKLASLVDLFSLLLCAVCLAGFAALQGQSLMDSFSLEALQREATRKDTYVALENVAASFDDQGYIVGLNLLVVFVRALFLVAPLGTNLGIIFRVVDVTSQNLLTFALTFLFCQFSFVIMAYFAFGAGFQDMSKFHMAFYRCFSMMTGKPIYDELYEADSFLGPAFYFVYYVLFYLIMINMFVSILLNGYDLVDSELKDRTKKRHVLRQLQDELRQDILGRCWRIFGSCASCGQELAHAFSGCLKDLQDCLPKVPGAAVVKRRVASYRPRRLRHASGEDEGVAGEGAKTVKSSKKSQLPGVKLFERLGLDSECMLMLLLMVIFIVFANTVSVGEEAYLISQASLHATAKGASWQEGSPPRVSTYKDVRSFQQLGPWTRSFLDEMYGDSACVVTASDGVTVVHPLTGDGLTQSCPRSREWSQEVQRVAKYNTGFLNTTFIRLTVQPACFVATGSRWKELAPFVRGTPPFDSCGLTGCVDVLQEKQCRSAEGRSLDAASIQTMHVGNAAAKYNYSETDSTLGSYGLLGGFVFSFGNSKAEALSTLQALEDGGWFSEKSASMVFDWITYNGNIDMFTHSTLSFSLKGTGEMSKTSEAKTFPVNVSVGGGPLQPWRVANVVLFWAYLVLVLYFWTRYLVDFHAGWKVWKARGHKNSSRWKYLVTWLSDLWHWTDLISLVISVVAIGFILGWVANVFRNDFLFSLDSTSRYQVPNPMVKKFGIAKEVDPVRPLQEDWYIFHQFETLRDMYSTTMLLAALNSFFISIKVVKYVGRLRAVVPLSYTLKHGLPRNLAFGFAMLMGMAGFSFFFHVVFGHVVPGFETFLAALLTIFTWVVGEYDLELLFQTNFVVGIVSFLVYMVCFYFIAVNMFLATMLNTYCEQVGKLDISRTEELVEKSKVTKTVEYRTRADLEADMTFVVKRKEDRASGYQLLPVVEVESVAEDGPAHAAGITSGSVLTRVNKEKSAWRRETLPEVLRAIQAIQQQEVKTGTITLTLRDPVATRGGATGLANKLLGLENNNGLPKPTVKNFWSRQGAVAAVDRGLGIDKTEAEAAAAGATAVPDEDEKAAQETMATHHNIKNKRARTKKRLERLLFSRWEVGKDGALVEPGSFWADVDGKEVEDECHVFEDAQADIDELREVIDSIPITGHEAWLDCLVTAVEMEIGDEESLVADLLRTADMQVLAHTPQAKGASQRPLQEFYRQAGRMLKILENKSQRKYFDLLRLESEEQQRRLRRQNVILHDYAKELEARFVDITNDIHGQKAVKDKLLRLLSTAMGQPLEPPRTASPPASATASPAPPPGLRQRPSAATGDRGAGVGTV